MSEQDRDQRTEQPTPKRLDDARRKGQVPRSRDLNGAAVMLTGGLALYALGGLMGGRIAAMMRDAFQFSRADAFDPGRMSGALSGAAWQALLAAAPFLGMLVAAALLAPLAIGGWNFSAEALAAKWDRLDPLQGLKRIFSVKGLFELAKSLARFAVVAGVGLAMMWHEAGALLALGTAPLHLAIAQAFGLAGITLVALAASLVLIAAADVPFTLWQHHRDLRMTKQEVRDEMKETEGHPEVKGYIRSRQQEIARRRMIQEVPKADVVVTNPTHYAVALRYDEHRMRAPVVVAKGADLIAARIREVAREHGVPVLEAPPLARALHARCELGDEIPARLYAAVAQVLAYVHQLRAARAVGAPPPAVPVVEVPEA